MSEVLIGFRRAGAPRALAILAVAISLAACGGPSPELTPLPAARIPPRSPSPKVIYALFDRSFSYEGHTQPALDRFKEVLPRVVEPGDQVIAAWMGSKSGDPGETFLHDQVRPVPYPDFPPDIDCPSEITTMQRQECIRAQEARNAEVERLAEEWEKDRQSAVNEFLARAMAGIENASFAVDKTGTLVYEAIYEASSVLASLRGSDVPIKLKLLIFSDMQESRPGPRYEVPLSLSEVDVVVAAFYFEDFALREKAKDEWKSFLENAGANSVEFLVPDASTAETLARLLTR